MRLIKWFQKEITHLLPPFFFFLAAFSIINEMEDLALRSEGIVLFSFPTVFLGAVIVAKVILIVDHMPFMNIFRSKPLIYNTLWKTCIYGLGTIAVRLLTRWIPLAIDSGSISSGYDELLRHTLWLKFWVVQILYMMLFLVYVSAREMIVIIGPKKVRKIFFGY